VIKRLGLVLALLPLPMFVGSMAHSANINKEVAQAYNDGIVRCANAECAKYLYACFRTYSSTTIEEFLDCGTKASRLNGDQLVVVKPSG